VRAPELGDRGAQRDSLSARGEVGQRREGVLSPGLGHPRRADAEPLGVTDELSVLRPGNVRGNPDLHVAIFAPLPCSPDQARCLVHRDTWSGRWFLLPISLIASAAATQKNGTVGTT
jgi:hypothetical protein